MMAEIASALQGVRVRVTAATAAAGRATEVRSVHCFVSTVAFAH